MPHPRPACSRHLGVPWSPVKDTEDLRQAHICAGFDTDAPAGTERVRAPGPTGRASLLGSRLTPSTQGLARPWGTGHQRVPSLLRGAHRVAKGKSPNSGDSDVHRLSVIELAPLMGGACGCRLGRDTRGPHPDGGDSVRTCARCMCHLYCILQWPGKRDRQDCHSGRVLVPTRAQSWGRGQATCFSVPRLHPRVLPPSWSSWIL